MTEQPKEETEDMDAKTDPQVLARLAQACDTKVDAAPTYRRRLERASRPSARLRNLPGI